MPYPRFTKVIIDYFLSKHKSLKKLKFQHFHTIKDDGVVSRLKFFRMGKDVQQYGLAIPATMLNKEIMQLESYKRLYHALMEALIEDENAMDKEVADTVRDHKRKHDDDDDDDEGPPAGSNQG
ncbi:hypothetical protein Tco_0506020, partial [Tanacetum coccineum]